MQLDRIERKLDLLVEVLTEEREEENGTNIKERED